MATGMSAAPIEFVIFHPRANDETVAQVSIRVPKAALLVETIAKNVMALAIASGIFRCLFIGRSKVNFIPESFINAAIDPVKVIPPMTVPKYEAIF